MIAFLMLVIAGVLAQVLREWIDRDACEWCGSRNRFIIDPLNARYDRCENCLMRRRVI